MYHKQIGKNSFTIPKIKPYVNNLNWNNINFPPKEQGYKTLEMNNNSIALNILQHNIEKISQIYKSAFNKRREKQVIFYKVNFATSKKQTTLSLCKKIKFFVKEKMSVLKILI